MPIPHSAVTTQDSQVSDGQESGGRPAAPIPAEFAQFCTSMADVYSDAHWSHEELITVTADVLRVIRRIATRYTDLSCHALAKEELEAEGRTKFIHLVADKKILVKFVRNGVKVRGEMFAFIKACVNNHIRGKVVAYRYTTKRAGFAPGEAPTPEQVAEALNSQAKGKRRRASGGPKPEVSLNDPTYAGVLDARVSAAGGSTAETDMSELMPYLTALEQLVVTQCLTPNKSALELAGLDFNRGSNRNREYHVSVECMAAGLGITVELFESAQAAIKEKWLKYMHDPSPESTRINSAIVALERVFNVAVPRSVDALVVRRLFTIAARANFELVTPDVAVMLEAVGAAVPQTADGQHLLCYGVLFAPNNRTCSACAMRVQCATEAANYGLDKITISPRLLSARASIRTAVVGDAPTGQLPASAVPTPAPVSVAAPVSSTPTPAEPAVSPRRSAAAAAVAHTPTLSGRDEEEVLAHIKRTYTAVKCFGAPYYKHATRRADGKVHHIVRVIKRPRAKCPEGLNPSFVVQLVRPPQTLIPRLIKSGVVYCIPSALSAAETIRIIDAHAAYCYTAPVN